MKETEQTLLEQIKDQVAKDKGYQDWDLKIYENGDEMMEKIWLDVCERYATAKAQASCEAALKNAAEDKSTAHSFTESAYKEFEKCTTCGKSKEESHYCSNSFHLSAPSESQEDEYGGSLTKEDILKIERIVREKLSFVKEDIESIQQDVSVLKTAINDLKTRNP